MNSDSRWHSESWDLFTDPAIHNAYHTPLHSVAICPARIQMCSARHAEDKTGSDKLSWEQTLIWVWPLIQIRASCTSRQTRIAHYAQQSTLTDPLHQACGTNREEKQPRRRDASATRGNNLVNVGKYTNLITLLDLCVSSQHSPTWLSRDSTSRGVAGVNMVVIGCSSQQKQRKKRNSDFSVMKIVFWRTSETKKSRKKETIGK